MPTISTIKPAGGGDYTSLAAWWSWANSQGTADQWAECYAGDPGPFDIGGDPITAPDASHYTRIYAVEEGVTIDNTGWNSIWYPAPFLRVEGISVTNSHNWSIAIGREGCQVKRCRIEGGLGLNIGWSGVGGGAPSGTDEMVIENCEFTDCQCVVSVPTGAHINVTISNNSLSGVLNGVNINTESTATSGDTSINAVTRNNVAILCPGGAFVHTSGTIVRP